MISSNRETIALTLVFFNNTILTHDCVLRIQKIPFRYDWEVVVKAVIDHVEKIAPEATEHLILRGDSFGGYLAACAAAYEKRIKACILNPGILNPMCPLEKLDSKWLRSLLFFLRPSTKFAITSRYMLRCQIFSRNDRALQTI